MDYFGLFSSPMPEQDDSGPFAKLFPQTVPKQPLPASFNSPGDPNPLARAILKEPDYKSPLDMASPPEGAAIAPPSLALGYPPHFARQALVDVLRPYLDAGQFVGGAMAGTEPPTTGDAITKLGGAALAAITPPGARGAAAAERGAAKALRPYQNVPDSLMGFKRYGQQKGFDEENYRHIQHLEIAMDSGDKFIDAIKGLNKTHAVERAYRNWPDAKITPISEAEARQAEPSMFPKYGGEP